MHRIITILVLFFTVDCRTVHKRQVNPLPDLAGSIQNAAANKINFVSTNLNNQIASMFSPPSQPVAIPDGNHSISGRALTEGSSHNGSVSDSVRVVNLTLNTTATDHGTPSHAFLPSAIIAIPAINSSINEPSKNDKQQLSTTTSAGLQSTIPTSPLATSTVRTTVLAEVVVVSTVPTHSSVLSVTSSTEEPVLILPATPSEPPFLITTSITKTPLLVKAATEGPVQPTNSTKNTGAPLVPQSSSTVSTPISRNTTERSSIGGHDSVVFLPNATTTVIPEAANVTLEQLLASEEDEANLSQDPSVPTTILPEEEATSKTVKDQEPAPTTNQTFVDRTNQTLQVPTALTIIPTRQTEEPSTESVATEAPMLIEIVTKQTFSSSTSSRKVVVSANTTNPVNLLPESANASFQSSTNLPKIVPESPVLDDFSENQFISPDGEPAVESVPIPDDSDMVLPENMTLPSTIVAAKTVSTNLTTIGSTIRTTTPPTNTTRYIIFNLMHFNDSADHSITSPGNVTFTEQHYSYDEPDHENADLTEQVSNRTDEELSAFAEEHNTFYELPNGHETNNGSLKMGTLNATSSGLSNETFASGKGQKQLVSSANVTAVPRNSTVIGINTVKNSIGKNNETAILVVSGPVVKQSEAAAKKSGTSLETHSDMLHNETGGNQTSTALNSTWTQGKLKGIKIVFPPVKTLNNEPTGETAASWTLPHFVSGGALQEDEHLPPRSLFVSNGKLLDFNLQTPNDQNASHKQDEVSVNESSDAFELHHISNHTVEITFSVPTDNNTLLTTTDSAPAEEPTELTTPSKTTAYLPNDPEDEKKFWSLMRKPLNWGEVMRITAKAEKGVSYPSFTEFPKTTFSCSNVKQPGFYADPEAGCQLYHRCDLFGRQYEFLCPETTLFSQLTLVCDYWYNVDCNEQVQYADYINSRMYNGVEFPRYSGRKTEEKNDNPVEKAIVMMIPTETATPPTTSILTSPTSLTTTLSSTAAVPLATLVSKAESELSGSRTTLPPASVVQFLNSQNSTAQSTTRENITISRVNGIEEP